MGEKPLGIDEAAAQPATIAGGLPPLGGDLPPPGMTAAGINTTRSNIKNSGSAAAAGGLPPKPFQPEPTRPGDPFPPDPGPSGGMAIKEMGVKADGGSAAGGTTPTDVQAMEGEPIPGIDVKLGKNPGGSVQAGGESIAEEEVDPMAAAGIITTRSNIKHAGAVASGDAGEEPPKD